MKKKEIIWREILYQVLEKKNFKFTQKDLAQKLKVSLSTVFNALKVPRKIGAVEVKGRFFRVTNPEKFLYLWGTVRNLKADIIYKTHVSQSVRKAESLMPYGIIYGAYTAYRLRFKEVPADYDKLYIYASSLTEIKKRFPPKRGVSNLIVLKKDSFLRKYGSFTPLAQTFVDLYNLPEWYAADFYKALKEKIDGILA